MDPFRISGRTSRHAAAIASGDWAKRENPSIRARFQIRSVTSIGGLASGRVAQGDQGSVRAQGAQRLAGDGPTDTVDDNVDALAPSGPVRALGQTFGGEVYDVFEPELARLGGFRCATGRRDYLAGALRPRELIDGVADRAADSCRQHPHAWLETSLRQARPSFGRHRRPWGHRRIFPKLYSISEFQRYTVHGNGSMRQALAYDLGKIQR